MGNGSKIQVNSGGVGFAGLLAILFIGLKLGHVIDWSWWWVLSPLWIPAGIFIGIIAVILFFVAAAAILVSIPKSKGKIRGR